MRASVGPRSPRCARIVVLLWLLFAGAGIAAPVEDSIEAVLERMKSTTAARIAYRETRYLELFEKPVESSGMLYGMAPDILIKEQRSPPREVMGIFKDHLYYFNPEKNLRHSQARDSGDPMNLHIAAFQSLTNGNRELLNELYRTDFFTEPGHWYMILTDKTTSSALVRITVSGASGKAADRIEIHQADGDRSVYRLEKDAEGEDIKAEILRLEAELRGR